MALAPLPALAIELVMVEQLGCAYCEQWDEEIGPIYPKTPEGKFAPLRRIDIDDVADEIDLQRRVIYTPTFLVVSAGREKTRLEGYPGEDFFWQLLDGLLRKTTNYDGETE